MNPTNKNLIIIGLLVVCGILAGGLIYSQFNLPGGGFLSVEEAAKTGLDYINEKLLPQGITASLVGEPSEEQGLYRFRIKLEDQEFFSYITKDGKILFPEGIDLESEISPVQETPETQETQGGFTIGNFSVSEDEVCLEDGKPIIYFFGSRSCSFCTWEHPIMERVAEKFTDYISFHNNMDSGEDMDVFGKYSTGGIPTLVFGCKYHRVGAGTQLGEEQETKNLTALICKLTGSRPADVCEQVQDLIQEIR